MSYASAAMQGTGMLTGAFGDIVQGQTTSDLLNYQATIQGNNATEALQAAKYNSDREAMMAARTTGAAYAGYGAAGVESTSGSVMATMASSAANAELDRQNILYGGEIRAINYENQQSLDSFNADNAVKAGEFNAFASLIGGSGKMISQNIGSGNDG